MSGHGPPDQQQFEDFKKDASVHGLLAGLSFLVVLPAGVLIARYMRTFNNRYAPTLTSHLRSSWEGGIERQLTYTCSPQLVSCALDHKRTHRFPARPSGMGYGQESPPLWPRIADSSRGMSRKCRFSIAEN